MTVWPGLYPPPNDPTYVASGYLRSGWWRRVGASMLDQLIVFAPLFILFVIVAPFVAPDFYSDGSTVSVDDDAATTLSLVIASLGFIVDGIYCTIAGSRGRGQTVGNMASGTVPRIEETGELLSWRTAFVRWFVRRSLYVLVLPGILNDLWPLWDKRNRTLADRVAGTVMVRQL